MRPIRNSILVGWRAADPRKRSCVWKRGTYRSACV